MAAEDKDEQKLSRRARRRAEQAVAESRDDDDERDEEETDDDEEAGDDEEASDDEEAGDDEEEASDDDEEERAKAKPAPTEDDDDRPRKPSKSEKKRSKQAEKSATAEIRDRNKRVREQAAERRRGKREKGSKKAAAARGLDTSEMVDDAFARGTHAATQFVRRHFNLIQWVVILGIAGGIGWQIYSWRSNKVEAKASDKLMEGVDAELARVGSEPPANPDEAAANPRPSFATDEERLSAATKAYDAAEKDRPGSGTSILATLGKAGVYYDQGKFDEARDTYEKVRGSALAQHDSDVRLRAVEGVGLSLEAKGDSDGALKAFSELEKSDEVGFSGLGLYHQARVFVGKGDKDKAKELLTKLNEKLVKERSATATGSYLERASRELMSIIDPTVAPPSSGSGSYSPEQLEALKGQIMKDPTKLKKMLEDMGKMRTPNMPVPMEPDPGGMPPPMDEAPGPGPGPGEPEPGSPEPGGPGAPPPGTGTPAP